MLALLTPLAMIGCSGSQGSGWLVSTTTPGSFSATGAMNQSRSAHQAVLLGTGQVLVVGGATSALTGELYNPDLGTFSLAVNTMEEPRREWLTATLLGNTQVLVAGGLGSTAALASAELFDPSLGTFTTTGSMTLARYGHSATLLTSGKVLICGGGDASAELYTPSTGTFSATGTMGLGRSYHTATRLGNGKVLIVGGQLASDSATAAAELYDPAAGTFSSTGSLGTLRRGHTATLLMDGTVLITGGGVDNSGTGIHSSAELYNPTSGTFTSVGSLKAAREGHTATLLASGKVLITGGYKGGGSTGYLASAELYDPTSRSFTLTSGSLLQAREAHTTTLLGNGKVLISGGGNSSSTLASAELFQ